ncbi:hypothetical protein [Nioella sp.]|uniref:hypothetical protein n=1 Tax=Nioella sp. TaxID=1912091 RepID=UPI0035143DA8
MSPEKKRAMIKRDHPELSISQQCKLVRLSRSAFYYTPVGIAADTLALMKEIDRVFIKYPFFGSRQIAAYARWVAGGVDALVDRSPRPRSVWNTSAMPDGRVPALAIRPGKASVTTRCHARSDFRSICVRLQRQRSQSATAGGKASTSKPLAVMSALRAPSAGPRSIVRPGSQGFFFQSQPSRFAALRASALSQSSALILPDKKALRCASR